METIRADVDRYVYAIDKDGLSKYIYLPRLMLSPRVWVTIIHRVMHYLVTRARPRFLAMPAAGVLLIWERAIHSISGIQITDRAHLGPGLFFTHEGGVVIGPIRTGSNCTISHGVTIGRGQLVGAEIGTNDTPVLGDRVWIAPGAVIAGKVNVGSDAAVGANSVVLRDLPPRAVALGNPARVVSYRGSFAQVHYRGMASDPDRIAALAHETPHPETSGIGRGVPRPAASAGDVDTEARESIG